MKLIHAMNETGTLEEFLRINPLYKGAPIKPNVLVSYNYLRGIALKLTKTLRDGIGSLNLDSGGYSIYTGKSLHTLHDYLSFVKLYSHLFDVVFSLDSDFNNPEGNLTNQLWLEEKLGDNSKKIVPVVHDKIAPFEELEMYAENGYNQVAVGSDGKLSDEFFEKVKAKYPDL